jgi:metal-responsive CopG/Arc/MetJ family transcriptional regulator
MSDHLVVLKLNQQQLELLDRTVARGIASDRSDLIRLALREYAGKHRHGSPHQTGTQAGVNK